MKNFKIAQLVTEGGVRITGHLFRVVNGGLIGFAFGGVGGQSAQSNEM